MIEIIELILFMALVEPILKVILKLITKKDDNSYYKS